MRTIVKHFRVPRHVYHATKGKGRPPAEALFVYSRNRGFVSGKHWKPHPRGGETIAYIMDDEGRVVASGVATCSLSDNFNYRRGREIALGRAMAQVRSNG